MTMAGDSTKLQVLIADDDPIQRSLVKSRLLSLNANAVEAEDGDAAWALMQSGHFDLAIVDLSMPNLDGIALTQCIRGHPRTRHIPVIVITSRDDSAAIADSFAAGASSFLVKPVVWSTFEYHIGFLLRLVESARDARTSRQMIKASLSAKEIILGNLCSDAKATAESVLDQVESLKRMYLASDSSGSVVKRLDAIAGECRALCDKSASSLVAIDVLSDQISVDNRKEPLSVLLSRVTGALHNAAAHASVTVTTSLPKQPVVVSCSPDSVKLALKHLLQNAIAHSPAGSTVSISAKCYPDGLLAIEITDQGTGMHPDFVSRCLAPLHWRFEGGEPAGQTGFGLPLAKAVAEAHNGNLELRSMPGQGTTALFTLPPDRVLTLTAAA